MFRCGRTHRRARLRQITRICLAGLAAGLLYRPRASAQTTEWLTPAGGVWSNPANWSAGLPSASHEALFAGQTASLVPVTVDGAYSLNALRFSGKPSYKLNAAEGGSISFVSAAGPARLAVDASISYGPSVAAAIILSAPLEVSNDSPKSLTLSGPISGGGSMTIDGGLVILSGANSYTGQTIVRGGEARIAHPQALGSVDAGTIVTNATLLLSADASEPIRVCDGGRVLLIDLPAYNTPFTIEHGRIELTAFSGQTTLTQPVILAGNSRSEVLSDGRRLVLSGGVTGAGDLHLGGDHIAVTGPLSHDGKLVIDSGRMTIAGPVSFTGSLEVSRYGSLDASVDATVADVIAAGFITIAPGKRLTSQSQSIALIGGGIDGQIGATRIVVTDGGVLNHLGDFAGMIDVQSGTLWAGGIAASAALSITSATGAVLDLHGNTAAPIALNNARGYGGGALICSQSDGGSPAIHSGPLSLGDAGSSVGGTITLAGPISGGSLDIVAPVFLHAKFPTIATLVRIDGTGSTCNGPTRVAPRAILAIGPNGSLRSTSELRVAGEVRLEAGGDRVADSIPIAMTGGTVDLAGVETLGPLTLNRCTNDLRISADGGALTLASLTRQPTAIARFTAAGQLGGPGGTDPRILIASPPALTNGIIGGWAISGSHFATYGPNGIAPLSSYAGDINAAAPTDNVSIAAPATLAASRTVHALRFEPGQTLNLGQHALEIGSGGVILQSATVQNGQLIPGQHADRQLILHLAGSGNVLNARTADTPRGPTTLILSGGSLALGGVNTHTGGTIIDKGAVTITSATALPAGGDVQINSAQVGISAGTAPLQLGAVALRGFCTLSGSTPLSAESLTVEQGSILSPLAGSGTLNKVGPGLLSLRGDNSQYTGLVDVQEGILRVYGEHTGPIRIHERGILQGNWSGVYVPVELNGGTLMDSYYYGPVTISAPSTLLGGYEESLWESRFMGPVIIREGGSLSVAGDTRAVLTGDIHVDGELSGPNIHLFHGHTVSGRGTIGLPLDISDGGILAPGNGVGTLTAATVGWSSGGTYQWEVARATGMAGIDWDLLRVTGGLGVLVDGPFTVQMLPTVSAESAGSLPGFDPHRSYAWPIVMLAPDKSLGPLLDLSLIQIDADAFLAHNDLAGGRLSLAATNNSIELRFTPVPEPALLPLLASAWALLHRRRRVASSPSAAGRAGRLCG